MSNLLTGFLDINLTLILIHSFCCFSMTGLIWVVQLVHYPSFHLIDRSQFKSFTKFHGKSISVIVLPLMLLEILTAFFLVQVNSTLPLLYKINFLLVAIIWASTFLLSVPIHQKLMKDFDSDLIKKLVFTNWPRTILWSLRSTMILWALNNYFS